MELKAGIVCIGVVLQTMHSSERVPCNIDFGGDGQLSLISSSSNFQQSSPRHYFFFNVKSSFLCKNSASGLLIVVEFLFDLKLIFLFITLLRSLFSKNCNFSITYFCLYSIQELRNICSNAFIFEEITAIIFKSMC